MSQNTNGRGPQAGAATTNQRPMGFMGGGRGPMGGMGMPVQKAKNFRATFFRLLGYFRPQKVRLGVVLTAAILSTIFNIVGPKILGMATTRLFAGFYLKFIKHVPGASIDFTYISHIMLILLGLYLFSSGFGYLQQFVMASVAQKTVYAMRRQVDEKLSRLPLKYYDGHAHGDIMSRAVNDLDNISTTLQQSLTQLITSVVTLVGVIILMLTISPLLTLVVVLTLPLSVIVTSQFAKRSQTYFAGQQRALGQLNGHVEEMFNGHKIVKAYGHETQAITDFDALNASLYDAGWRAQFVSGMIFPMMNFIGNIGYVFVAVIGGVMVTRNAIAIGDVQAFIQYARQFTMPITQLASITNTIQLTIASAERVFELLDEEEEIPDPVGAQVPAVRAGAVRFDGIDFGYSPETPLIKGMTIDVKPGQMIAIVGPTGAGKTTMVNLLMRFYDVTGGRILVDGIDIRDVRRGDLRRTFGMVLQDTWLFNGTIHDNIAYGRTDANEEEIVAAAKAAQADHFIRTLPESYQTILNQEASNISQGQKQLLTIARAFLADPEILILDEATSSVDTRTEILIQHAMSELMKGRTSFVIAHRLSTIRDADLILVMNHGTIVEQGTHEQLLAAGGFYADLYNSQFTVPGGAASVDDAVSAALHAGNAGEEAMIS